MVQPTANVVIINSVINDAFEADESDDDMTDLWSARADCNPAGKKVVLETANPIHHNHDAQS